MGIFVDVCLMFKVLFVVFIGVIVVIDLSKFNDVFKVDS